MKKFYLGLTMLICCIARYSAPVYAQCPIVNTSTIVASHDTTLPCGPGCVTLNVLSSSTTLTGTNAYTVGAIPFAPDPYTGTNLPILSDDVFSSIIGMPFPFCFWGNKYTSCVIGSNANISFNTTLAGAFDDWQITGPLTGGAAANASRNAIMFPMMDFLLSSGGNIRYATYGTAPCRRWAVTYDNVAFFNCTATRGTTQVVMYESTNIIDMFIQSKPVCAGWNSGRAITAIENAAGSAFVAVPGQNGTSFTATNQGWRFTPNSPPTWIYRWYDSAAPAVQIALGTSVVVCPTITATYYVKGVATSNCDSVVVWDTIHVFKSGEVKHIVGPNTVCTGNTITLTDSAMGGSWTSLSTPVATVGSIATPGISTGIVTGVSAGTASIIYSTGPGCADTVVITVMPNAVISGTPEVCMGSAGSLSASITGGTWSSGSSGIATIDPSTGATMGINAGTAIMSYTSPNGCVSTKVYTVDPLAPIGGPTGVCEGNTIVLTNPNAGTWASTNPAVGSIGATTGIFSGLTVGTTTVIYTTNVGSCISTIPVTVNVTPVAITGTLVVCEGLTTTLNDATPGGSWVSGTTGIATVNAANGIVTGVAGGVATISYVMPTGCYTTISVTVNPLPAAISGATQVCLGSSITAINTTPGGTWSSSDTAVASIDPATGVITSRAVGVTTITYTLLATGCIRTEIVRVNPIPPAPGTATVDLCQHDNNAAPLTGVILPGGVLNWYTVPTGGTSTPSVTPPTGAWGETTWYVSQTVAGCEGPRAPLKVVVHHREPFAITPVNPKVCQFDTLHFAYDGPTFPGATYFWALPEPQAVQVGGSTVGPVIDARFDTSYGDNLVMLTVGDGYTPCNVTDTYDVDVYILPYAEFYIAPDVCLGDTLAVALTGRTAAVTNYTWDLSGATVVTAHSNTGGPMKVYWDTEGQHIVTLTSYNAANCPAKVVRDTVFVHKQPDARMAPIALLNDKTQLCLGDSVYFAPKTYDYRNTYMWTPEHFFTNDNSNKIVGRVEAQGYVRLTVTDPYGCKASSNLYLDPQSCCVVSFPNAFTPNNDGNNDVFRPITPGNHKMHIFRIANRWGQTVYESTDENSCKWDGTYNGEPQDMGVYFYYMKYNCDGHESVAKGEVNLIR